MSNEAVSMSFIEQSLSPFLPCNSSTGESQTRRGREKTTPSDVPFECFLHLHVEYSSLCHFYRWTCAETLTSQQHACDEAIKAFRDPLPPSRSIYPTAHRCTNLIQFISGQPPACLVVVVCRSAIASPRNQRLPIIVQLDLIILASADEACLVRNHIPAGVFVVEHPERESLAAIIIISVHFSIEQMLLLLLLGSRFRPAKERRIIP